MCYFLQILHIHLLLLSSRSNYTHWFSFWWHFGCLSLIRAREKMKGFYRKHSPENSRQLLEAVKHYSFGRRQSWQQVLSTAPFVSSTPRLPTLYVEERVSSRAKCRKCTSLLRSTFSVFRGKGDWVVLQGTENLPAQIAVVAEQGSCACNEAWRVSNIHSRRSRPDDHCNFWLRCQGAIQITRQLKQSSLEERWGINAINMLQFLGSLRDWQINTLFSMPFLKKNLENM